MSEKCSITFVQVVGRQNLQNRTIFELYTDDNKSKYFINPKGIFKSEIKILKIFTPMRQLPKLLLLPNFLAKIRTERTYLMNNVTFVR